MHVLKKSILLLFALFLLVSVSGCNTMRGIGKDLKKGGEAIERAAD